VRAYETVKSGAYDVGEAVITTSLYDMVKVIGGAFEPDYTWQEFLLVGEQCDDIQEISWARKASVDRFVYGESDPLVTFTTQIACERNHLDSRGGAKLMCVAVCCPNGS